MKPNWFIGLPVSAGEWFATLPAIPEGVRLFGADDLHLTVAFLGGVTEEAARAAWNATRWSDPPSITTLGAVVPMGNPRRYSALSLLLEEGREAVEAGIGRSRDAALAAAGARPDDRPPKAHITIARPKRSATDAQRAAALVWASGVVLPRVAIGLDAIALYTWTVDRASSLFRVVERAPLPRG